MRCSERGESVTGEHGCASPTRYFRMAPNDMGSSLGYTDAESLEVGAL